MILPLRPKSLIRDFDYSDLWRHAESRGGNVLQFNSKGRKEPRNESQILSPSGNERLELRPVSQRGNEHAAKQILNRATQPVLGVRGAVTETGKVNLRSSVEIGAGFSVKPLSPSPRRRPNGTYKNFPSLWAAFWLLVGLVKSGR